MASSNTELDIANRALNKLGVREVTSLTSNVSDKTVKAINNCLDSTRDALLRENPWNFAIKRVSIASDSIEPIYQYDNAYRLPSDFLYLMDIGDELNDPKYSIEGDFIVSDQTSPLLIRYVSRVIDVTRFDSLMTEAWASLMAYEMCMILRDDVVLRDRLENEYKVSVIKAKRFDGQENHSQEYPLDELIRWRR